MTTWTPWVAKPGHHHIMETEDLRIQAQAIRRELAELSNIIEPLMERRRLLEGQLFQLSRQYDHAREKRTSHQETIKP